MKTSSIIFGFTAIVFTLASYTVVQTVLALDCDCICLCKQPQIPTLGSLRGGEHTGQVQDHLNTIGDQINQKVDQINQRLTSRLASLPELPD